MPQAPGTAGVVVVDEVSALAVTQGRSNREVSGLGAVASNYPSPMIFGQTPSDDTLGRALAIDSYTYSFTDRDLIDGVEITYAQVFRPRRIYYYSCTP